MNLQKEIDWLLNERITLENRFTAAISSIDPLRFAEFLKNAGWELACDSPFFKSYKIGGFCVNIPVDRDFYDNYWTVMRDAVETAACAWKEYELEQTVGKYNNE